VQHDVRHAGKLAPRSLVIGPPCLEPGFQATSAFLDRGAPSMENELWNVSTQVLNGTLSPEDAAKQVEAGLAQWYKPHQ
jgi:raffinose/stachyose/melibiose transport system substrate-binding protein